MKLKFLVEDSAFKTSSYSDPGGIIKTCVTVAITQEGVAVRDSKDESRATQFYTHDEWRAFVNGVRDGQFSV